MPDGRSICVVNDQTEQPPLFIDVATFGPGTEACQKYLSKGRQVAVTGRLAYYKWQAKDGSKRSKHTIIGRVAFGAPTSAANQVPGVQEAHSDA